MHIGVNLGFQHTAKIKNNCSNCHSCIPFLVSLRFWMGVTFCFRQATGIKMQVNK